MGLLSFLQKKPSDKTKPGTALAAQPTYRPGALHGCVKTSAYDSAVPGASPLIGAYPVAGNGRNVLESLSRTGNRLNETQISLETASIVDHSAPSPAVPRFREEPHERPSTAPHGSQPTTNWASASTRLRKNSLKGRHPPVSLRSPKNEALINGHTLAEIGAAVLSEPPTVAPNVSFGHSRSDSIRSASEGAFKDILDAQSEIHPADFKARVEATGIRDYGEDVADRNIGENGVHLESPQVQAFYSMSSTGSVYGYSIYHPGSRVSRRDDSVSRPGSKQSSYEALGIRTKSLNSTSHYAFQKRTTSHTPPPLATAPPCETGSVVDVRLPSTVKSTRRQSLHTYMPTGSHGSDSRLRGRPTSFQRGTHGKEAVHYVASIDDAGVVNFTAPSPDLSIASSGSPRIGTATMPRHPSAGAGVASYPSRGQLDTTAAVRRAARTPSVDYATDDVQSERYIPSSMSFSHHKPYTYSQRGSVSTFAPQRQSGHTLHSSISSSIASYDTAVDFTPLAYPNSRPRTGREDHHHHRGRLAGMEAVDSNATTSVNADASPSHCGRTSRTSDRGEGYGRRERSHSMASTIGKGRHDDISDQVPARTSSLRHWSISSATPSNASSNSLPHSRHTADTSLDLSNAFSIKSSSRTSLNTTIANSPRTGKSSNFNIDDYVSSDEDDFTTPRPRGEGEEELLFNDSGYGADGFFLPGLCHGLSSSSASTQRPRSVVSMPSGALQTAYGHTGSPLVNRHGTFSSRSPRGKRRYVLDTAADSDSEDGAQSDLDSLRDPRDRRFNQDASPVKNTRGTKRLSAIGTLYGNQYYVSDVIEEERLEKIDISAAVKLRKEIKTRKRESQMANRRAMLKGKQAISSGRDAIAAPEAASNAHLGSAGGAYPGT